MTLFLHQNILKKLKIIIMKNKILITICCFIILISIVSCNNKKETPAHIIDKQTFEQLLFDLHLADAIVTSKVLQNQNINDSILYINLFNKYNCTRQDFDTTLSYYIYHQIDTINAMYDRVIKKYNIEQGNIY